VQRGHSNNAILNFLRVKRGYCEQFAGAYAAMARSLGIPARVAVGFTPGELRSDGKYHVYGRNAHAWPEVWFDNIGWISFEPTPGRGEPGTQSYTGLQPAQAAALGDGDQSTPVSTASTAPTTTIPGEDVPTTTARAGAGVATTLPAQAPPTSKSGGGISPWAIGFALVLAAVAGWLLLMPRVVQAMHERRLGHSPTDRIEHSWRRAASSLALVGMEVKTGETPVEHAQRIERKSGIDRRTLRDLAGAATAAIYGGVGDERAADHSHALASEVIASVRRRMTLSQKLAVMFDPRRADLLVTR